MNEEITDDIQKDIQWHPAFVSAMNLELAEDRENLTFESEYNLNMRPLEIDLLIIKKERDAHICNEIGHFFKAYNVLEYKSPGDHLNVDTYYKAAAYACLYKAYADTVDGRKAEDLTITLLRDTKPDGLFRYFKQAGSTVEHPYGGIYYLGGSGILFPTQIIVTRELEEKNHAFLRVLTEQPHKQDISRFLKIMKGLDGKADREYAESILDVFTAANRKWMEQWKGDTVMSTALLEIMAPELQKAEDKGRQEGRREGEREGRRKGIHEGIRGTVSVLYNLGFEKTQVKEAVMKQYGLSESEMAKYL